ncbi:MAG: hypothetical protein IPJ69_14975 [Deltaproteobacteria bacterium]|nr:MAG: hypothetical protein IPJ69_14975 [Deltaproteobacteria bacterium]
MKQPNQPDMSWAMVQMAQISGQTNSLQSNNAYNLGIRQISQQETQSNQMYMLARHQLSADERTSRNELEAKLEIATMNFNARVQELELGHGEKMKELDVRRHEIDAQAVADARAAREEQYF